MASNETERRPCFIFTTSRDADVYDYLRTNYRGEVDEIEASAKAAKVFDEGRRCIDEVADIMADDLRELFILHSPVAIHVEGYDDVLPDFENDNVFGWLLCDAIGRIDFAKVALAFLQDVELPPPPPLPEA
jgi:hypothetical protein